MKPGPCRACKYLSAIALLACVLLGSMSLSNPVQAAASVNTLPASSITPVDALLNGELVTLGTASSVNVSFEYGVSTDYGGITDVQPLTAAGVFNARVSGLIPGTLYHFRAKADDGMGNVAYGFDLTFSTTLQPYISKITATTATLGGNLISLDNASVVNVSFEYGTTAYDHATANQPMTSPGVFSADISGLAPATTYHFRVRADSGAGGVSYSGDISFTTENSFSVPLPSDISTDPKVVATNTVFASVTVLLLAFAAALFNSTFRGNYEAIQAWSQGLFARLKLSKLHSGPGKSGIVLPHYLEAVLIIVLTAIINSFVDPAFGISSAGLIIFIAMVIASVAATYGYDGIQALTTRHGFKIPAAVKTYPLAIPIAVACVIVSRLAHFAPGLVFGFVGAYALLSSTANLDKRKLSINILLGVTCIALVASAAFFLRQPLANAAPGFWHSLADTIMVATFVTCLEGLVFGLLPLTFLDGSILVSWNKWVWIIVFGIVSFLFYHIIINNNAILASAVKDTNVVTMLALVLFSVIFSIGFWLYFRIRKGREHHAG